MKVKRIFASPRAILWITVVLTIARLLMQPTLQLVNSLLTSVASTSLPGWLMLTLPRLVTMVILLIAAGQAISQIRSKRRDRHIVLRGRCMHCNYDVTGCERLVPSVPVIRCPECGNLHATERIKAPTHPYRSRFRALAVERLQRIIEQIDRWYPLIWMMVRLVFFISFAGIIIFVILSAIRGSAPPPPWLTNLGYFFSDVSVPVLCVLAILYMSAEKSLRQTIEQAQFEEILAQAGHEVKE